MVCKHRGMYGLLGSSWILISMAPRNKISQHQERKKEDSTQGEYAYFRLARSARVGV